MDYNNFDILNYNYIRDNYSHEELYGSPEDLDLAIEILDPYSYFSMYYNKLCDYQKSRLFPDIYEKFQKNNTEKDNNIKKDNNIEKDKNCKCKECMIELDNEYYYNNKYNNDNYYESDYEFYEEDYDY